MPGGGGRKEVTIRESSARTYLAAAGGLSQKASAVLEQETARGTRRSRYSIERLMLTLAADNSPEWLTSGEDIDLCLPVCLPWNSHDTKSQIYSTSAAPPLLNRYSNNSPLFHSPCTLKKRNSIA